MMVSTCYHITTQNFATQKECEEWVCSIEANAMNVHPSGDCVAKRCENKDPKLVSHWIAYDVYFRI